MSKIFAEKGVLEYCQKAKPGNKTVYVNMDAINELPDQFEVVLTELKFDIKQDFSDVGSGNLMPTSALMYRVAEATGISGGENSVTEPVVEEIDVNPMLFKPADAEPTFRKMIVGRRVKKFSTLLQEDGTLRRSSPCTSIFNVWERCMELWTKEEMYTEGYSKKAQYPPKYDNTFKRRAHFNAEMKFAHAKAETKAHSKTIRELAGLMTGYTAADLKEGKFIFSKVRKSQESLKLEQAANLSRISGGGEPSPSANLLFPPDNELEEEMEEVAEEMIHEEDPFESEDVTPTEPTDEEKLLGIFQTYEHLKELPADNIATIGKCIKWLESNPDQSKDNYTGLWKKIIGKLKSIESNVDIEHQVEHEF